MSWSQTGTIVECYGPRLRRESGDNTVLSVGETNVVVGTTRLLLLASIELLAKLRMSILNELEPSSNVGISALSDKTNSDLVCAKSSPDLLVLLAQAVATEVGSQSKVLVELGGKRSQRLEVGSADLISVEAHYDGLMCIFRPVGEDRDRLAGLGASIDGGVKFFGGVIRVHR